MQVTLAALLVVGVAGSALAAWLLASVPRRVFVELRSGHRSVEIMGIDHDVDVEVRINDDGIGMDEEPALAGPRGESDGLGMHNVDRRLCASFGEEYGLQTESEPEQGTAVRMAVPKFRVGVRAA